MVDELGLALSQVASCHLDIQSSKKRKAAILEAQTLISTCDENDDIVNAFVCVGMLLTSTVVIFFNLSYANIFYIILNFTCACLSHVALYFYNIYIS